MSAKVAQATGTTILAAGSALQGELRVQGEVLIDGAIAGNVVSKGPIAIGPEGRVLGEVRAETLRVEGRIDGIARARGHLWVLRSGQVHGHASYDSLEVERGGVIAGSSYQALPGEVTEEED